ncbi:MAG: response regulator transcription factor [Flavobacteriales bacterium]|jgi:DNA-binding NarL/FixJ family response regulator|nr:response regulator transcription factor [Flavobacteriales bacterium]MBK8710260.1 response regulator transcription factor [Flavobacteriales bacterium]MCC7501621.1 response regulator transcription factor [Flavobacteriales bacterium]
MATKRSLPAVPAPAPDRVVVGIAHDENVARRGLRDSLRESGIEVAIAVDTLADLEVGVRSLPEVRVLVAQLHLPVKQMTPDLERLMRRSKLPVIVIGALNGPVVEALVQLDVKGVLTNKVLDPELVLAVQVVAQGGMHANNWMLDQLKHKRKRASVTEQRDAVRLTERESEVAQCILAHPALSYLGTGNLLGIGERTVETHVRSLLKKYHQPNRLSWLAFMMQQR